MATRTTRSKPQRTKKARRAILGKKLGMTQVFSEAGRWIPVTVLQAGPCTVLQVKTPEGEGYSAVQLGFDETKKKRKWPQQAYLEKHGLTGAKFVHEVPFVDPAHIQVAEGGGAAVVPGVRVGASAFKDVKQVESAA
jgi:large subunit ribosomal protein L3